jgi:hypothetical protein
MQSADRRRSATCAELLDCRRSPLVMAARRAVRIDGCSGNQARGRLVLVAPITNRRPPGARGGASRNLEMFGRARQVRRGAELAAVLDCNRVNPPGENRNQSTKHENQWASKSFDDSPDNFGDWVLCARCYSGNRFYRARFLNLHLRPLPPPPEPSNKPIAAAPSTQGQID